MSDIKFVQPTKIEEIISYLQKAKDSGGFYGKVTEIYEGGKKVRTQIEVSIKN